MKAKLVVVSVLVVACLLIGAGWVLAQEPEEAAGAELEGAEMEGVELSAAVGTAFTYQGRLLVDGRPANGVYDLKFILFSTSSLAQIDPPHVTVENVTVTNGTFSVVLDFGTTQFRGGARWLGIGVRPGDSTGAFTSLTPRQELRPVPYAMGLAWPVTGTVSSTVPLLTLDNSGNGNAFSASSDTGTAIVAETGTEEGPYVLGFSPAAVRGTATGDGFGVEGSTADGVGLVGSIDSSAGTGDPIQGRAWQSGMPFGFYSTVFRVDRAGEVYAGGTFHADEYDLAERIEASETVEPGDVVEIDPINADQYRLVQSANSPLVAGVISTAPGMILGDQGGLNGAEDTRPQLAMAGTVPVKVCDEGGPIQPGDLLVASSTPGRAMAAPDDPAAGTVIGKALGSLESGEGTIKMLVMLR